jgi:hypothetical protein
VKCDSGTPVCTRCKSTGRKCDGYQPHRVRFLAVIGGGPDRRPPNPSLTHNANAPEEARALQFYRERTALTLSDHSHSDFWLRLVPQVSYSDLAIKHMIITLASIEEALDTAPDPWPCYDTCLKHHSKAIGSIIRTSPSPPVEVVLIFSVLFATYYNMQGKSSNALDHVENGLNIVREWRASRASDLGLSQTDAGSEVIEKQIGPMFANFEEQITDLHSNPDKGPLNLPKEISQPQLLPFLIPRAFSNFDEAHRYLRGVMSLVTHAMQLYSLFPSQKLESIRALQARNYLDDWLRSFETCKKAYSHQPSGHNVSRTGILLEIHYRAFCIMLESFPVQDEMRFDSFNADFGFIIAQSRALITDRPSHVDSVDDDDMNHFRSMDDIDRLGLIPPLFLTATRCRVPYLRRQALSLLRILQSVESVWDSMSAARIAEQVMLIEERGLDMVRTKTEISEHRRIRLASADFDAESGKLRLKFRRFPYRDQGMIQEEQIVWSARVSSFNRIESVDPVSLTSSVPLS